MAIASGLFCVALASAASTPSSAPATVPAGQWGGMGVALDVTSSGAKVELDCAHGTIDAPLVLDAERKFDLPGTLVFERPGPVREGDTERRKPVRWEGQLEGETLTLDVVLPNAPGTVKPLAATRGQSPRLRKCG